MIYVEKLKNSHTALLTNFYFIMIITVMAAELVRAARSESKGEPERLR